VTTQKKKQGEIEPYPVVGTLAAIADALKNNPWYFSIVGVMYINGIGLNSYLLNKQVSAFAVFDNFGVGIPWLGLVAIILLVRASHLFPLSIKEAKFIVIGCLVISSASVMTFMIFIGISNGVQGFAIEVRDAYGYDLRLALKAILGILWFITIFWLFIIATRAACRAIKKQRESR